ncbi:MAG: flagellar hook assembly protein FlgD [Halomonadaceae bacterium]|nr:MAG: flagellar hook assembly protein FlgD [Halomonadaceae bacterium]
MNSLNGVSGGDVLKDFRLEKDKAGGENRMENMGQNEFMTLMLAQLNNQSPLDPQDNGAFVSQLAQFSSLEEMQKVTGAVENVANQFRSTQALQASAMVGRSVLVDSNIASLSPSGNDVKGSVALPGSTSNLTVSILNPSGDLVQRMSLGPKAAGEVAFSWNGENSKGELMPPGDYQITAEGQFSGASEQLKTSISANVDSVSLDKRSGITLNLAGRGAVPLSDVRQIN